jgi:hypothetical protein
MTRPRTRRKKKEKSSDNRAGVYTYRGGPWDGHTRHHDRRETMFVGTDGRLFSGNDLIGYGRPPYVGYYHPLAYTIADENEFVWIEVDGYSEQIDRLKWAAVAWQYRLREIEKMIADINSWPTNFEAQLQLTTARCRNEGAVALTDYPPERGEVRLHPP